MTTEKPGTVRRGPGTLDTEVARLTAELAEAQAHIERLLLCAAVEGHGVDPNGYYYGTPGQRVHELLAAEAKLAFQEPVIPVLANAVEALRALVELKDGPRDEGYERAKPSAWAAARICLRLADRALASLTPDTWTPAKPGDTPGAIEPGEDVQIQPIDLMAALRASLDRAKADRRAASLTPDTEETP